MGYGLKVTVHVPRVMLNNVHERLEEVEEMIRLHRERLMMYCAAMPVPRSDGVPDVESLHIELRELLSQYEADLIAAAKLHACMEDPDNVEVY